MGTHTFQGLATPQPRAGLRDPRAVTGDGPHAGLRRLPGRPRVELEADDGAAKPKQNLIGTFSQKSLMYDTRC